jgi:hypothetical protein
VPEGYVVGSFEGYYVEDTTKYWNIESGVFTTWDWDLGADNGNFIMDLDLVSEVEVTAWKGLPD